MSLRDQLLKAGLASKKDRQKAERALKKQRKRDQGHAKKKGALKREEAAAREAKRMADAATRRIAREANDAKRAAHEHQYRVGQLLDAHRLGSRGSFSFHVRYGERVVTLKVHPRMAESLRGGDAAVARTPTGSFVLIARKGAEKLVAIAPEVVVFFQPNTKGLGRADMALAPEDPDWWLPDLRARRATEADITRFQDAD